MSSRKVYTEDDVPNMLDDDLDLGEIFFRGVKLMKLIALICTI